jgi:hypothetical protein
LHIDPLCKKDLRREHDLSAGTDNEHDFGLGGRSQLTATRLKTLQSAHVSPQNELVERNVLWELRFSCADSLVGAGSCNSQISHLWPVQRFNSSYEGSDSYLLAASASTQRV